MRRAELTRLAGLSPAALNSLVRRDQFLFLRRALSGGGWGDYPPRLALMTMIAIGLSNAGATQALAGRFVDTEFGLLALQGLDAAEFEKSEIYFGYAVLGGSEFDVEIDGYSTLTVRKPVCGSLKAITLEIRQLEKKGGMMALVIVNASESLRTLRTRLRDQHLSEQLIGEAIAAEVRS